MTIKAAFFRKIGTTKTDFLDFGKCAALRRPQHAFSKALESFCNKGKSADRDYWDDDYDTRQGYGDSAGSCCGTYELSDLTDGSQDDVYKAFLGGLRVGYRHFIYYSISPRITRIFQSIGFKVVDTYKNHNTGNTVKVLTLKV